MIQELVRRRKIGLRVMYRFRWVGQGSGGKEEGAWKREMRVGTIERVHKRSKDDGSRL